MSKLRENSHYSKHPQDMQVSTIKRVDAAQEHFFRRCKDPKEKRFLRKVRRASSVLCVRSRGLCANPNLRQVNVSVRILSVKQVLGITA